MRFKGAQTVGSEYRFAQSQLKRGVDKLEQFYTFTEPEKIRQFLQDDPVAVDVLVDALPRIQSNFDVADLAVSLNRSSESQIREATELYIRIVTPVDVDEALNQLEQFDRQWWLDQPAKIRDRICFDVDFE